MRTLFSSVITVFVLIAVAGCGTYKSAATFDDPNGNFHLRVYIRITSYNVCYTKLLRNEIIAIIRIGLRRGKFKPSKLYRRLTGKQA